MFRADVARWTPAFPWIAPRFVWAVVAVAGLVAAGTFAHIAIILAIYVGVVVAGLFAADLALGPSRGELDVVREPVGHFSLRSPAHLGYRLNNRSAVSLRFEIVDTPLDALDLPEAPVTGVVGARMSNVAGLPAMPRLRGPATLGTLYVTCLLYTSPSPRDYAASRMPSSA